jgi:hypothetical protein
MALGVVLTTKRQCLQADVIYLVAVALTANALYMMKVSRFTADTTFFVDQARINISANIFAMLQE